MVMRRINNRLTTQLNKKVEIWHTVASTTRNELGQKPVEDQLLDTVYAGIIPQTGSLLTGRTADTDLSRTTHKVIMRYRDDLTPDMWIMAEGVRYDILYIMDPYLNHERLEIFCEVRI